MISLMIRPKRRVSFAAQLKSSATSVCSCHRIPSIGRRLDDPAYYPIYAAAQDLNSPITLHSASGSRLPQVSASRTSQFGSTSLCTRWSRCWPALTLLGDGLLERFPHLTVAHFESVWLASVLAGAD